MIKPTGETLSQYVERVARQKKLNFHDIERNSGGRITNSYISKIISGKVTNLTADKTVALAAGLEVSPFEVFAAMCGQSVPAERDHSLDARIIVDLMQKIVMNPRLSEIVQLCERMPHKTQDSLLVQLRYLREKDKSHPTSHTKKKR